MNPRNFEVVLHPGARLDALEAARYIASNSDAQTAIRWYEALEAAIDSLSTMPHRCGLAPEGPELGEKELRHLIFKSHRIVFTVWEERVYVLHIRHTARDS